MNGDGWSTADSQVVCRQLGYLRAGNLLYAVFYLITENMEFLSYIICSLIVASNTCTEGIETNHMQLDNKYLLYLWPEVTRYVCINS